MGKNSIYRISREDRLRNKLETEKHELELREALARSNSGKMSFEKVVLLLEKETPGVTARTNDKTADLRYFFRNIPEKKKMSEVYSGDYCCIFTRCIVKNFWRSMII